MMSVWFLGLAIGPGLGGMMTQQFGIHETFYMIGLGFLGGALANGLILSETKDTGIKFPWRRQETDTEQQAGVVETVKKTTLQWVDLMKDSSIQSTMLLYAVYWAAMTGAHFTVLPFLLTDPNGLALEPIQVGQVFTAFACTQMAANPVMARVIDYIGSGNGVIAGCALYGASIAAVASSPDTSTLFPALGLSAVAAAMMNTAPTTFLFSRASLADRPQALALLRTSGDFGFLVGAALAGAVADFTGSFGSAMQSCSSLLALGTIWYAARQAIDHCSTASSKKE